MGFWNTFREFDKTSLLVIAIDFVSLALVSSIFYVVYGRIMSVVSRIPDPDILLSLPLEQVQEIMTPDPTRQIIASLIVGALLVISVYCLGRAAVWQLSIRKFAWKGWLKASLVLFIWLIIGLILVFQAWRIFKQPFNIFFAAVLQLLIMHIGLALSVGLRERQEFNVIWRIITDSFRNIHKFLLLYLIIGLLLLLVAFLMRILPLVMPLLIVFALLVLAILCWGRYLLLYLLSKS